MQEPLIYWIFLIFQLFVWIYIISSLSRDVFFNLYVNRVRTLLFRPVTWIQNIAPKCPEWLAAIILFILAIVFQGAIIKAISLPIQQRFGYSWINADLMSFYKTAGFIGLSFFLFICKLNIIRMAMCWRFGVKSRSNVVESLNTATAPLSLLPLKYSAVLTFVTMFAIVNGMMFFYKTSSLQIQTDSFTALVKWFPTTLKLALLAIADVLVLMRTLIIAVFIVQIAGMIMSNRTITGMAGEWFSEISRLFLNRPFVVGGIINLTPLIALFVLDFAHKILIGFISGLF